MFTALQFKKKDAAKDQRALERERIAARREADRYNWANVLGIDKVKVKTWGAIKATCVDSQGLRYELAFEENGLLWCWVKQPSPDMVLVGCSHCPGPHRPGNQMCWASCPSAKAAIVPPGALMDMKSGELMSGRFSMGEITWNTSKPAPHTARTAHGARRAGRVILTRL